MPWKCLEHVSVEKNGRSHIRGGYWGRRKARSEPMDFFLDDKKSSGSVQSTKTSYKKEVNREIKKIRVAVECCCPLRFHL